MIVSVKQGFDPRRVQAALAGLGLWTRRFEAGDEVSFLVLDHSGRVDPDEVAALEGVGGVSRARSPHPLVDDQATRVEIGGVPIGAGAEPVLMAGPCSVDGEETIEETAAFLARAGARFLRGGAFKPRSSPHDFQGLGEPALRWLASAARRHGLLVVTEALSEAHVELVAEHAALVQVGSRNMHNTPLLRAVGRSGRPVLVKRGLAATVEEWLAAGEYCLDAGAPAVVFCERGLRGFDGATRNVLDLGAVALLAHVHRQPVIVDPSHALGRRDLIGPLARAALAAGSAGLLVETHPDATRALSDAPQALSFEEMRALAASLPSPRSARSLP